jgi:hypothetical protein
MGSEFPGGCVEAGYANPTVEGAGADYVIIAVLIQEVFFDRRPRGNHLDDVPLDNAPGTRLTQLLADGHLFAGLEQSSDIGFIGMVGDAAHRLTLAFGKRKVQ